MNSARAMSLAAACLVLIGVAGCTSTVEGSGSPVSGAAATSSATPGSESQSPGAAGSATPASRTTPESGGLQPPAQHTTVTASSSPSQLPTPAGRPTLGASLDYKPACPLDAASEQTTSAEVTLDWSVTNATGIKVGIDDSNIADGTPFNGTSGQNDLTLLHCYQPYTFDVWTTGGGSGQTAHDRFVYNPS